MQNQPNQTNEFQINLAEFEELAKEFIGKQSNLKDELWTTDEEQSAFWIDAFKEFIFSDQMNQQKRKEEYFKLKEQLESMKGEFEPEIVQGFTYIYTDNKGCSYKAVNELQDCEGCAFENDSYNCEQADGKPSCYERKIICKKK